MTVVDRHPDGWVYEDSDWSVGLTTSGWYHDACPLDIADAAMAEQTVTAESYEGTGTNRLLCSTFRLDCSCGASTEVTEKIWDPEPDDEPNAWEV